MDDAEEGRRAADGLRRALVDYVGALHGAYLSTARGHGADPAALPLAARPFTVAVVAADRLHLVATADALPALRGHERPVDEEVTPLRWRVRFFDASVVPELGLRPPSGGEPGGGEPGGGEPVDVLGLLGVARPLYHLIVGTHSTLTAHHAAHAGTGLANAHTAAHGGGAAGGAAGGV